MFTDVYIDTTCCLVITDGDTITILDSYNKQHKIRLYGIDTPEKKQAFGKAAKKHTSRLTYKKKATVKTYDTDKYDRTVAVIPTLCKKMSIRVFK